MIPVLQGKYVVLGVTGSIACYKAVDLASKLTQAGALVDVVMTEYACRFVTPLAFGSITHRPVVTNLFDLESELAVEHVALATRADLLIVAPATAHAIAKLALGLADDPLTTTALATKAPLLLAPAMDAHMYEHPALQENLATLKRRGAYVVGPASGRLASGLVGPGRMVEPQELLDHVRWMLGRSGDLAGRDIVVTAGGTREPLDPVRVITNRSSGKMGYALAEAARDRGARVTLVAAPTDLPDPVGVALHRVETVREMRDAVLATTHYADVLVMAAAVSDYRPAEVAGQKMKKEGTADTIALTLLKNADFLPELPSTVMRVGFAAETQNVLANARRKLEEKGLALIVANDVTDPDSGFGVDTNRVTLIDAQGDEELPLLPKYEVAHRVLDRVLLLLQQRDAAEGPAPEDRTRGETSPARTTPSR